MSDSTPTNNYVLGRGKIYFDRFTDDVHMILSGERYIGNTPALTVTTAIQNLDHYSSDYGIREKDASVQLQLDRTGSFQFDNIIMENIALLFGTDAIDLAQTAAVGVGEHLTVKQGLYYALGADEVTPDGVGEVANVTVSDGSGAHAAGTITVATNPADADTVTIGTQAITFHTTAPTLPFQVQIGATPTVTAQGLLALINANQGALGVHASGAAAVLTLAANVSGTASNSIALVSSGTHITVSGATMTGGTDSLPVPAAANWEVDLIRGRLHILDDATGIIDGQGIDVKYDIVAQTRSVVIDQGEQVEGALRFIADNPEGTDKDFYWPRVKLSPSGDFALKGDTWQTVTMNFDVLLRGKMKRVYIREAA